MRLSDRLEAVLALVAPCGLLVDVGTDHGLVPLEAIARGLAREAVGIDRGRPLAAARANAGVAGWPAGLAYIEGLGLAPVADRRPDTVVIAGMGARSATAILRERPVGMPLTARIVVQPMVEAHGLRRWARTHGLHVLDERLVHEEGRYQPVLALAPGEGPDPAYDLPGFEVEQLEAIGPILAARRDPLARAQVAGHVARLARHSPEVGAWWARALAALETPANQE